MMSGSIREVNSINRVDVDMMRLLLTQEELSLASGLFVMMMGNNDSSTSVTQQKSWRTENKFSYATEIVPENTPNRNDLNHLSDEQSVSSMFGSFASMIKGY